MKRVLENRKHMCIVIVGLIVLSIGIFMMNYIYYFMQEPQSVGGGIWKSLLSIPINLLVALFMTKAVFLWDDSEWKWVSYPLLMVWLMGLVCTLNPEMVFTGEPYTTFLSMGPHFFSYLLLLLILLIFLVPLGMDGIMEKKLRFEEIWVSLGIFISTSFIVAGIKDLQGALWCGALSVGYYLCKRNKVLLIPIFAAVVPIGYGVFYGFKEKLGLDFLIETIPTLFVRKYDVVVAGQAYYMPFQSLGNAFSFVPVILVLVMYVILVVLLWNYVKRYVKDEYKPRGYVLCWGIMISWGFSILYELGWLTSDYYGNAPFSTSGGLIWIVPILYIIMMGKSDKKEQYGN